MEQAESYCYPIGMTVYKSVPSLEDGSLGRWWLRREDDIWDFPIFLGSAWFRRAREVLGFEAWWLILPQ